jgi:hypothetical protein
VHSELQLLMEVTGLLQPHVSSSIPSGNGTPSPLYPSGSKLSAHGTCIEVCAYRGQESRRGILVSALMRNFRWYIFLSYSSHSEK